MECLSQTRIQILNQVFTGGQSSFMAGLRIPHLGPITRPCATLASRPFVFLAQPYCSRIFDYYRDGHPRLLPADQLFF